MFNIIPNVKTRDIITTISLEELVNLIKNPSMVVKKSIDLARTVDRKSPMYTRIKKSLPCLVPNYNHHEYVRADTAKISTGYLYLDIDEEVTIEFSKFTFIAAAWNSMSGKGKSILVSVDNMPAAGCSKKTIQNITEEIASSIGLNYDPEAVSRDRLIAIPYDYNIYYNSNHSNYTIINKVSEVSVKRYSSKSNKSTGIRMLVNDNFISDTLRMSNFEEMKEKYSFNTDEAYKDLKEEKLMFTEVFIPKKISNGARNSKIYNIVSKIYGLNPNADKNLIYSFMLKVNSSSCEEPLSTDEIIDICSKVLSREPELYSNKKRTFIFNDDYSLTGAERKTIAVTESNKKRATENTANIMECMAKWDTEKSGKMTYLNIAILLGIGKATVARRAKEIKESKNINTNVLVNSL